MIFVSNKPCKIHMSQKLYQSGHLDPKGEIPIPTIQNSTQPSTAKCKITPFTVIASITFNDTQLIVCSTTTSFARLRCALIPGAVITLYHSKQQWLGLNSSAHREIVCGRAGVLARWHEKVLRRRRALLLPLYIYRLQ